MQRRCDLARKLADLHGKSNCPSDERNRRSLRSASCRLEELLSDPESTRTLNLANWSQKNLRPQPVLRLSKQKITSKPTLNANGLVECHSQLKTIASTLFNVANNIRWLGSGPRCGFYEIALPTRQPGSSIMPGKVNPVMCESMMQLTARVMGNDQAITVSGAAGGQFQLNIMMPVMCQNDARKRHAAQQRNGSVCRFLCG